MIWLGLTLTALAGLLWAERLDSQLWIRRLKPLASVGFLGWALHNGALQTAYGQAIVAGLVLSWFGDVFLLSKRTSWFLAGLIAFLGAHIAYIVAFVGLGPAWTTTAMTAAGLTIIAWAVRRWLRPSLPEDMKRPVDVYIVVITMMVATAFAAWRVGAPTTMLAGAIAFYLSDLSVARDRFVSSSFTNRLWGLPMYYVAQLLLGSTC
ncbi:MAG: lysoplasmalogenase [Nannocystaceae bacterium]|nr:lysoplasmalogenase [Nannocystaceae bacterium]